MIRFLKNSDVYLIKQKLVIIYILNVIDIVCTFGLLKTGLFEEANWLMVGIVNHALLSIFIKLLIPACLMIYVLINLDDLPTEQLPICNIALNVVFIVYSIITLMHLIYTIFFIYTLL
ncbi:MAG: DUF5658 family protein [Cellulosilyticaceae bacterium]